MSNLVSVLQQFSSALTKDALKLVVDSYKAEFKRSKKILEKINPILNSDFSKPLKIKVIQNIILELKTLIKLEVEADRTHFVEVLNTAVAQIIEQIPIQVYQTQDEKRFIPCDEDPFYTKSGKFFKRTKRSFQQTQIRSSNVFRKLFKKDLLVFKPWQQVIEIQAFIMQNLTKNLPDFVQKIQYKKQRTLASHLKLAQSVLIAAAANEKESLIKLKAEVEHALQDVEKHISDLESQTQTWLSEKIETYTHQAEKLGTFELHVSEKSLQEFQTVLKQKLLATCTKQDEVWNKELLAREDVISQEFELIQLEEGLKKDYSLLVSELVNHSNVYIFEKLRELGSILGKNETHLAKQKSKSEKEQIQQIEIIKKDLALAINEQAQFLENIAILEFLKPFTKTYEANYEDLIQGLSPTLTVILEYEEGKSKPKLELKELEWSSLIHRIIVEEHLKQIQSLPINLATRLNKIHEKLLVFTEIIDVNAQAAIDAYHQNKEEIEDEELKPIDTLLTALQRVQKQLEEWVELEKQFIESQTGLIDENLAKTFTYLKEKLHSNTLSDLESKRRELQVRSQALGLKVHLEIISAKVSDFVIVYSRYAWKNVVWVYDKIQDMISPKAGVSAKQTQKVLGEFLTNLDTKIENLPLIYRKLFSLSNEPDLRYFTGLANEKSYFLKAVELWQKGLMQTIALIGESGSGKSLFTSSMFNQLDPKLNVFKVKITSTITDSSELAVEFAKCLQIKANSLQEIQVQLEQGEKKIILIDALDSLFLRKVDGFTAIEDLLILINATSEKVLWITHISRYSWAYLDKVLKLSMYFSTEIETDKVLAHELRTLLLKRHRASGYQLRFEPDEEIKKLRAYKKVQGIETERQAYLDEVFFEQTHNFAEGNATIAIIHWLSSLTEITQNELIITVSLDWEIQLPTALDSDEWFTLAYFIQHTSLTIEHHAQAFHQSKKDSQLLISRLEMLHLLVYENGRYGVNIFAYRPVIKALKRRNILH